MSTTAIQPHQQRVVDEAAELAQRLNLLNAFVEAGPVFPTLTLAEQDRMRHQAMAMSLYLRILRERIGAFR